MDEDKRLDVLASEMPGVVKEIKAILLDIKSVLAEARSPLRGKTDEDKPADQDNKKVVTDENRR